MEISSDHAIMNYLSQSMTKPTKWPVHPAKTQISLGFAQSSLPDWRRCGSWAIHKAHSEDWSDWTIRLSWCPGCSVSLLGAQVILLVSSCCCSVIRDLCTSWHNELLEKVLDWSSRDLFTYKFSLEKPTWCVSVSRVHEHGGYSWPNPAWILVFGAFSPRNLQPSDPVRNRVSSWSHQAHRSWRVAATGHCLKINISIHI